LESLKNIKGKREKKGMNIALTIICFHSILIPLISSLGRLLEKSDIKGAEKCYRDALAIDKNNASAHNCLGVVLEVKWCLKIKKDKLSFSFLLKECERA
jgi:hypothetical protein